MPGIFISRGMNVNTVRDLRMESIVGIWDRLTPLAADVRETVAYRQHAALYQPQAEYILICMYWKPQG